MTITYEVRLIGRQLMVRNKGDRWTTFTVEDCDNLAFTLAGFILFRHHGPLKAEYDAICREAEIT